MVENTSRIKVAMICHFSNAAVRACLPLGDRKLYALARRLLGLPPKSGGYGDMAGWDTYMIELLCHRPDIDLYVISAHSGLVRRVVRFEMDNVHYTFLRVEDATLLKYLISSPSLWHRLNPLRPLVRKTIKRINPDIIALIGAENAHISGTVLGIGDLPLIVKCQTIYNNPDREKFGSIDAKNAYVERLIFRDLRYVSVGTDMHCHLFRQFNQVAYNFSWNFGNLLPDVKPLEKVFDFVNFAMAMNSKKGFPDSIRALSKVKTLYPEVKLNLVGAISKDDKEELYNLVADLQLADNVVFTPFFERQEDLFQHLQKSRFAVLPCKMDSVSSTIRQAMHYKLPVVCYRTDGTPKLNLDKECVLIAENGNVDDLASKMLLLLSDQLLAEKLRHNANEFARRWSDDEGNSQQMADIFHAVIDNYRNDTPIPKRLLFIENP